MTDMSETVQAIAIKIATVSAPTRPWQTSQKPYEHDFTTVKEYLCNSEIVFIYVESFQ